MVAKGDRNL